MGLWENICNAHVFWKIPSSRVLRVSQGFSREVKTRQIFEKVPNICFVCLLACLVVFNATFKTIFQLYRGGQFYWWRKPPTCRNWDTDELYHIITQYCTPHPDRDSNLQHQWFKHILLSNIYNRIEHKFYNLYEALSSIIQHSSDRSRAWRIISVYSKIKR